MGWHILRRTTLVLLLSIGVRCVVASTDFAALESVLLAGTPGNEYWRLLDEDESPVDKSRFVAAVFSHRDRHGEY